MSDKISIEELAFEIEHVLKIFPYVNYPWNYLDFLLEDLAGQSRFEKLLEDKDINFIDSLDGVARMFFREFENA